MAAAGGDCAEPASRTIGSNLGDDSCGAAACTSVHPVQPSSLSSAQSTPAAAPRHWRWRERIKRIKNDLVYAIVRVLVQMLGGLPHRLALALGAALGRLGYLLAGPERRRALANLARAGIGGSAGGRRRLVRRMFSHIGKNAMECVVLKRLRPHLGTDRSPVQYSPGSRAALEAAVAKGRGVLFVTAHIGNWELMAAEVARVAPVSVFVKPSYDPRFTRMIGEFRRANGVEGISVARPGHLRSALAALRRGEILGVLLDQAVPTGCLVPFMGHLAWTSTVVESLERVSGASVVWGAVHRCAARRHSLSICSLSERKTQPARGLTHLLTAQVEAAVRAHPSEWMWSLDRWRSTESPLLSSPIASSIPASNS
jgi:KDO2-lipid IV(A) lauroyltransferase